MTSQLIFIAIPTKGTVNNGALRAEVLQALAALHVRYPDYTFVCPMVQDYQILPYLKVTATWQDWGAHCRTLINRSDQVWVLMYEGWTNPQASPDDTSNTSVGVAAEIRHAQERGIPVCFMDPPMLGT